MSLRAHKIVLKKVSVARMEVHSRCHDNGKIAITLYSPADKPYDEIITLAPQPGKSEVSARAIAVIVFFYKLREYDHIRTLCAACQKEAEGAARMEMGEHPAHLHPLLALEANLTPISCVG